MLSALILPRRGYPAVRLAAQPVHRRSVRHGPLVLVTAPRKTPTPTIDRDRTVSRRSEPSSRATLMGEQPNPWDLLQPPDHYAPVSCLLGMSASQSSALMPLHSLRSVTNRPEGTFGSLRYAFGGDHPSQTTHQAVSALQRVRPQTAKGPYFKDGSTKAGAPASKPPAYPTHRMTKVNAKL